MIRPGDVVLFQGDSITNAFRRPEELNNAYQLGSGYALIAASQLLADRPGDRLMFLNRGVSGDQLSDVLARWTTDCLELRPTVISLLVGINHALSSLFDAAEFDSDLRRLFRMTMLALPSVRWLILEPFGFPIGGVNEDVFDRLRDIQAITRSVTRDFQQTFVPMQARFDRAAVVAPPQYWIYDGVHPTAAGHRLIAQAWLEAAGALAPASAKEWV